MAGVITITNLSITESHGITGNKLIPTSVLKFAFDVAWSGLPADTNMVGMIAFLMEGTAWTGHALSVWDSVTPAASGTAHIEKSFTITQMNLDGHVSNLSYDLSGRSYSASGGVNTADPVSNWAFEYRTYAAPTIPSFLVNRCQPGGANDDSGEKIEVSVTFSSDSIGGGNAITLKIYRKLVADSTWVLDYTFTLGAGVYSGSVGPRETTLTYLSSGRYDIKAELVDRVSPAVTNVKSIAPGFTMGECDPSTQRESFMKSLEADSPSPGNDFGEVVRFRKYLMFDDIPGTLKRLGLIAASAIAAPRGAMTGGTFYLMKWTQISNADAANLVPFTIAGDSGIIRGWKVKRAGWYRFSHILKWNSGSTASASAVYSAVVPAANQANILDTLTEANVAALSTYPLYQYLPSTTTATTQSMTTDCVYLNVDDVIVVYAATVQTKTQDTAPAYGRFSIERVA